TATDHRDSQGRPSVAVPDPGAVRPGPNYYHIVIKAGLHDRLPRPEVDHIAWQGFEGREPLVKALSDLRKRSWDRLIGAPLRLVRQLLPHTGRVDDWWMGMNR